MRTIATNAVSAGRRPRTGDRRASQTLVEFALIFPLLAVLLSAVVQWGFIFSAYATLRHGAQVSSRMVSLARSMTNELPTIACDAISPALNCANLQPPQYAPATVGSGAASNAVQVTLTYDLPLVLRFVVPGATGNNLTLTATAIDRKL